MKLKFLFSIAWLLLFNYAIAQSPGGVSAGLKAWYKADAHTAQPSGWPDQSGNGKHLSSGGVNPTWTAGTATFNFNPVFNFTGASQNYFYSTAGIMGSTSSAGSIFGVAKNNGTTGWQTLYGFGDDDPNLQQQSGGLVYNIWRNNALSNSFGTGINTSPAHIPNMFWSTTGGTQGQINGSYSSLATSSGPIADNLFVVGTEGLLVPGAGYEQYEGNIPEVIVYNQNLTGTTDAQKINSYLGIKYGVSLSHNYLSSNGSTIYSVASYSSNIVGIGRDDASALYQKQSTSVSSACGMVIGLGANLYNTNQANTSTLSNNQFLVAGNNGLGEQLNTSLAFFAPGGQINNRFAATWKVQNTGSVGIVTIAIPAGLENLHLVRSTDATITSADEFIAMTGSATINGVSYNTAQITLNNGDYFTFAGYAAAGPGGVNNNLLGWFVAGDINGADNSDVTTWQSSGAASMTLENQRAAYIPKLYKTNSAYLVNFNPTVRFSGTWANTIFMRSTNTYSSNPGSIYAGIKVLTSNRNGKFGWNASMDFNGIHITNLGTTNGWTLYASTLSDPRVITPNTTNIVGGTWTNSPSNSRLISVDGAITTSVSAPLVITDYYGIGSDNNWSNGPMDDLYGENIVYSSDLSDAERYRLESYLAIKYGVTLRNGTTSGQFNYVNSSNAVIWNGNSNTTYHNNVFGIARDLYGGLNQKVSKTINSDAILTAATTNNFTSNNYDGSRNSLSNDQFVMFGDNNNTSTALTALSPVSCPALSDGMFRIAKEWRVQETGVTGPVWIEVDLSGYSINSEIVLYFGDNAGINGNSGIVSAYSFVGGKAVFYVDFKDNGVQYFTIAGKVGASTCATCIGGKYVIKQGASWNTAIKKANDSTSWFSYAVDGENTTLLAKNTVTYTTPSNQWVNAWYPTSYGTSALMPHVGNTGSTASKVLYKTELNKAGKVSFELAGINEWFGNKVKVVVRGYCGTDLVMPIITPKVTTWAKRFNSHTITNNTAIGKKYYMGLSYYSTIKVNFSKPVERIEIEYTVERSPVYYTFFWLTVGDMKVECGSPIEPNKDNVFIKQSFEEDTMSSCNAATMKLNIINRNCNGRTINITNNLPSGIEYVADSYESDSSAVPTYAGQNFSLSNFNIPSGETNLYIKVKPSSTINSITTYNTQSNYNVTVASGGTGASILSDNLSANWGLQPTAITFKPSVAPIMPLVAFTSNKTQDACGLVTYTITINNNTGATMNNLQLYSFLNLGQLLNGSLTLSSGLSGNVFPTIQNNESNFFITNMNIPVGTHTITFQTQVNQIDEFASNSIELFYDPASNECALSSKVVANLEKKCATCMGGNGIFDMNYQWFLGGATARTTNQLNNIAIGNPASGALKANATVVYPSSGGQSIEWLASFFPRWNGNWTELSRFDNLNGASGKVTYSVKLKDANGNGIAAKPSFQISGITKLSGQANVVSVKGYCGSQEVLPKLLFAYNNTAANNALYRRFTITDSTATATGTKVYFDSWDYSTMNVEFEKSVDSFVIEWAVNRAPIRKTLGYLYISDVKMLCDNIPEPNADNVHIIASFANNNLPTCEEALIKLNIKNWNCVAKTISITNTLPAGLQYVANSYVGLGTETPTYNGQSFSLSNLTVPSGNSYIYAKVKTSSNTTTSYATDFKYTVVGGTNSPNPYQSDDESGIDDFQDIVVNYTAGTMANKPTITKSVNKCFSQTANGDGTELTYTITVNNSSTSAISNVEFLERLDGAQEFVANSLSNPFGGTVNNYATDKNILYITGMTIPGSTFNNVITFKVLTKNTDTSISNQVTMTVDPESACGSANRVFSNEVIVTKCPYCVKDPITGTPSTFGNVGFTTQSKQAGWPDNVPNAALVLESSNKGFVITRMTLAQRNAITGTNLVEGMLIYVTDANGTGNGCFQLYNGSGWKCIERACNY
jgi:uncharacterized repeat protein (TIGR01451 family)